MIAKFKILFISLALYSCAEQNWHQPSGAYDFETNYIVTIKDNAISANDHFIGKIKSIENYPSQFTSKPNQQEIRIDSVSILDKHSSIILGVSRMENDQVKVFFIQVKYGKGDLRYRKTKRKIRKSLNQLFR